MNIYTCPVSNVAGRPATGRATVHTRRIVSARARAVGGRLGYDFDGLMHTVAFDGPAEPLQESLADGANSASGLDLASSASMSADAYTAVDTATTPLFELGGQPAGEAVSAVQDPLSAAVADALPSMPNMPGMTDGPAVPNLPNLPLADAAASSSKYTMYNLDEIKAELSRYSAEQAKAAAAAASDKGASSLPSEYKLREFNPDKFNPDNYRLPDVKLPEVRLPEFRLPEFRLPEFRLPEFSAPEISLPEIGLPDIQLPEIQLPELKPPQLYRDDDSPFRELPDDYVIPPRRTPPANTGAGDFSFEGVVDSVKESIGWVVDAAVTEADYLRRLVSDVLFSSMPEMPPLPPLPPLPPAVQDSVDQVAGTAGAVRNQFSEAPVLYTSLALVLGVLPAWTYYKAEIAGFAGTITARELVDQLDSEADVVVIDLRPREEQFKDGVLDLRRGSRTKAESLPMLEVPADMASRFADRNALQNYINGAVICGLSVVGPSTRIVIMDSRGARSKGVARAVTALGGRGYVLQGGFAGWQTSGLSVKQGTYDVTPADVLLDTSEQLKEWTVASLMDPRVQTVLIVSTLAGAYVFTHLMESLEFIGFMGLQASFAVYLSRFETPQQAIDAWSGSIGSGNAGSSGNRKAGAAGAEKRSAQPVAEASRRKKN